MIKINLLPLDRQKREFPLWKLYRLLTYVFLGLTLIMWAYNLGMYKYLNSKITDVNTQIGSIKVWEERYNKTQAENSDIQKREQIVNSLNKNRMVWSRFIAELGNVTPAGCWLDNIKDNSNNNGESLTIKGGAMNMDILLDYVSRLQTVPNVADVQIADTAQTTKNNTKFISYTLLLHRNGVAKK
jgi:Tfp pilus assembly protein PilN